jgi:hypothetical protein
MSGDVIAVKSCQVASVGLAAHCNVFVAVVYVTIRDSNMIL